MRLSEIETKRRYRPEIFLDMDGVLADFFKRQAELVGVPTYRDISPEQNERSLNQMVGTDFFATLDKTASADSIIKMSMAVFGHYNICSSPLRGDFENSEKNKKIWIAKHLNPLPKKIIITPNKDKFAVQPDGTPNILVDDRGNNITGWEAAGGVGIKYQADEDGLDVISAGLKRAFAIIKGEMPLVPQQLKSRDRSQGKLIAQPDQKNDQESR